MSIDRILTANQFKTERTASFRESSKRTERRSCLQCCLERYIAQFFKQENMKRSSETGWNVWEKLVWQAIIYLVWNIVAVKCCRSATLLSNVGIKGFLWVFLFKLSTFMKIWVLTFENIFEWSYFNEFNYQLLSNFPGIDTTSRETVVPMRFWRRWYTTLSFKLER